MTFSQGANCDKTFIDGSHHRTRLPIITLRVVLATREQQSGSFKEVFLGNGKSLVLCCGFMGSVRLCYYSNSILANERFFQRALERAYSGSSFPIHGNLETLISIPVLLS
jgi:hypothetical protein